MTTYEQSEDLKKRGEAILDKHLVHLRGLVRITYMFKPEASVSDGKTIAGKCIKVDARNRTLHDYDFIIEIARDVWDEATEEFRYALLHHELLHVGVKRDDDGEIMRDDAGYLKTYCRRHDIEDFEEILEVHGAYHAGLRSFLDAFARNKTPATVTVSEEQETADAV